MPCFIRLTQRVRRHVDQFDFVSVAYDAVRDELPDVHAGDVLDDVRQALQVLDVDGALRRSSTSCQRLSCLEPGASVCASSSTSATAG